MPVPSSTAPGAPPVRRQFELEASGGAPDRSAIVAARTDFSGTAVNVIRLGLGQPLDGDARVDWDAAFAVSVEERCGALIWNRSGSFIRAHAPSAVAARWRAHAIECDAYGRDQLDVLSALIADLERASVRPVVLKGPPLALRLYGDGTIRGSADIDVFVPVAERSAAERALLAASWQIVEGESPWTQTFSRTRGADRFYLEVHSSLLDFNLAHLAAPAPTAQEYVLGEVRLPVHDDDMLPAYLAAHAAKHMPVSLLYDFDFQALWSSLDLDEKEGAIARACTVGLTGYLSWMIGRSLALQRAAGGDRSALSRLGIEPAGRRAWHAMFRDVALAPSPLSAARSVAAWVWPQSLRRTPGAFLERCAHRLRRPWAGYLRKRQRYSEPTRWTRA